ncbi:MAG: hypothetical protein ACLFT6_05575, partial [Bacteroidales bacterium]
MLNYRKLILGTILATLCIIKSYSQEWVANFKPFSSDFVTITDARYNEQEEKYYLTGRFTDSLYIGSSDTLIGKGSGAIFIASFDQNYNPLWIYEIDGDGYELRSKLDLDDNGNLYVSGVFTSSNCSLGNDDAVLASDGIGDNFLAKFSSDGKFQWVNHLGRGESFQKNGKIMVDNSNDIIATL